MDFKDAYEWGNLFASPWEVLSKSMGERAAVLGFSQEESNKELLWLSEGTLRVKFCFVDDPSEIESIREIFNNDQNTTLPSCFIVVKQPDPSDKRGEIIFDIFLSRLLSCERHQELRSTLWSTDAVCAARIALPRSVHM